MEELDNPYLKLRASKIARNQARLAELGLLTQKSTITRAASKKTSQSSNATKRAVVTPAGPLRRSTRSISRPSTYTEPAVQEASASNKRKRQQELEQHSTQAVTSLEETEEERDVSPTPSSLSPWSVRSMDIHVGKLVLGNDDEQGLLGQTMERTGKAFVMEESVRQCMSIEDRVPRLSFNKYSGVQEWKNDAMFLWVNLGGPAADVVNDFLQEGRQITWFGGSRMHDESNVIRQLLKVGKRAARDELSSDGGIVLWVRMYDKDTRGFTPYMCLGRLSYYSHEPGRRPLKFVWNLLDYEQLLATMGDGSESSADLKTFMTG